MTAVVLRAGIGDPLFVVPGLGGNANEFAPLAAALRTSRPVIGIELLESAVEHRTVEALAGAVCSHITTRQPHGPYHLAGYSFGGLLALEAGNLLRAAGEPVPFLGLIDAMYDRRYWPFRMFVAAIARRTTSHLARIVRHPSINGVSELFARSARLGRRLASRTKLTTPAVESAQALDLTGMNTAAMADWRPARVDGPVVIFSSDGRDDFACEPAALWRPWITDLDVRRVPGSHVDLLREASAVSTLASQLDEALEQAQSPALRVLVATTFGWESASRLAIEFARTGYAVEAVGPSTSALRKLSCVRRWHRLDLLRPLTTLGEAITTSRADLIVPADDRTRQALQRLHAGALSTDEPDATIREIIERSLGDEDSYDTLASRSATLSLATDAGVRCPTNKALPDRETLLEWIARHNLPAVMKTDGSWGGREVIVVHTVAQARDAWAHLQRPTGWAPIAKRFVVDRDPWPLRNRLSRTRPVISIQQYIAGRPSNAAVACLDGELLGAVLAEVLHSDGPLGPSSVIRVIEHVEMLATAQTMVRRLGMTGLCGLDFILDDDTGHAHLLEINARATPTAHLTTADGIDLLTALRNALGRSGPGHRIGRYPDGVVALFPQEMQRDPKSPFLTTAYHDVPIDAEAVGHLMPARPKVVWRRHGIDRGNAPTAVRRFRTRSARRSRPAGSDQAGVA